MTRSLISLPTSQCRAPSPSTTAGTAAATDYTVTIKVRTAAA
jgi:hypothetical protein